jgi:ABC-type uncharacterized transport system permease subunit
MENLDVIAVISYLIATLLQARNLLTPSLAKKLAVVFLGILAIGLHGWLLHLWIDLPEGQNLSAENLLSMMFWLSALLTLLSTLRMPVMNLILFIYPIAALSIVTIMIVPGHYIIQTQQHPEQLTHIFLAIITMSMLCIAALQAIFLAIQERALRHKTGGLLQILPPLETMETFLFQTIALGFILLTLLLLSSFFFFQHLFTVGFRSKSIPALIAWIIFAMLLGGRYFAGWRGKIAIRGTLIGFILLLLIYLGTELLIGNS